MDKKKLAFEYTFIVKHGWMISKLNLKNYELDAFALIWGFCQDGETEFRGSFKYIQKWLTCGKTTAIKTINSLDKKKLIIKRQEEINSVTFNRYSIDFDTVDMMRKGQTLCSRDGRGCSRDGRGLSAKQTGVVRETNGGCSPNDHYNNFSNIIDKDISNNEKGTESAHENQKIEIIDLSNNEESNSKEKSCAKKEKLEFQTLCEQNGLLALLSYPKPLSDTNTRKLLKTHGHANFIAELRKINAHTFKRAVKDLNKTILLWFRRNYANTPIRTTGTPQANEMIETFSAMYAQKNGIAPTISRYDIENVTQIAAQLTAYDTTRTLDDLWRGWLTCLYAMKPAKDGFTWSDKLLGALSKNFSSITLKMRTRHEKTQEPTKAERKAQLARTLAEMRANGENI